MLCGHSVLKILKPCATPSLTAHGSRAGMHPEEAKPKSNNASDNIQAFTYGPGVCAESECRSKFGLLSRGKEQAESSSGPYTPDEEQFDMSPAARLESERRWRAQLTPTQSQWLDARRKTPDDYRRGLLPPEAKDFANHPQLEILLATHLTFYYKANNEFPETRVPEWWAFNPRYMTAFQLYQYTPLFLDAHVANPGAERRGPAAQHPTLYQLATEQDGMGRLLEDVDVLFFRADEEIRQSGLKDYSECDRADLKWLESWLPDWERLNNMDK